MPKNTKKSKNAKNTHVAIRPFITKSDDQEYAQVVRLLGDCRLELRCFDHKTRLGIIRNKMRRGKQNKIKLEDIVLISKRDFQDAKADVIHVYTAEEVARLQKMKHIPKLAEEEDEADSWIVFDRGDATSSSNDSSDEESDDKDTPLNIDAI